MKRALIHWQIGMMTWACLTGGSLATPASDLGATEPLSLEHLIDIKVEPEGNSIHQLWLGVDDEGTIVKVIRQSSQSKQEFDVATLANSEVVLARSQNRDVLILSCPGCSPKVGGTLHVKYLDNGIINKYVTIQFQLEQGQNAWELYQGSTQVENLTLVAREFFGQVIGIKEIKVNAY